MKVKIVEVHHRDAWYSRRLEKKGWVSCSFLPDTGGVYNFYKVRLEVENEEDSNWL